MTETTQTDSAHADPADRPADHDRPDERHGQRPARPARTAPPPTGIVRATAIVATIATAIAVIGLGLLLRPVESPVQDCGTALAFLLHGRTDVFADPESPPDGLTADEVRASNERPCRARVLDAARPGAILFATGVAVATLAALVEVGVRGARWVRSYRSGGAAGSGDAGRADDTARSAPDGP